MHSLLFDTNALIYSVCTSAQYHEDVQQLLRSTLASNGCIYALASSLNDVYYVLCRHYLSEPDARSAIRDIAETFDLVDLTGLFVFESIDSDEPDYEDGLIRVAAEELQVNAIISYDKAAFKSSFIPKMTAREALETFFRVPQTLTPKPSRITPNVT
ncbi:PIN domain-containing protein [Adlercreutzia sp. ZJ138]|uniref:type II toxin-antitoxin system VapC family toxin n=1 Tax=Adlercreutzia sp. ZJ138 TaxID=2709405 RepID=UPI0013EA4A92|nr:PIN domain-containing protein [Adlercreutzia sp. ZJ138]